MLEDLVTPNPRKSHLYPLSYGSGTSALYSAKGSSRKPSFGLRGGHSLQTNDVRDVAVCPEQWRDTRRAPGQVAIEAPKRTGSQVSLSALMGRSLQIMLGQTKHLRRGGAGDSSIRTRTAMSRSAKCSTFPHRTRRLRCASVIKTFTFISAAHRNQGSPTCTSPARFGEWSRCALPKSIAACRPHSPCRRRSGHLTAGKFYERRNRRSCVAPARSAGGRPLTRLSTSLTARTSNYARKICHSPGTPLN